MKYLIVTLAILVSCNQKDTPELAVQEYYSALNNHDSVALIKRTCTQRCDFINFRLELSRDKHIEPAIYKTEWLDSMAVVKSELRIYEIREHTHYTLPQSDTVVFENGVWKVCWAFHWQSPTIKPNI